MRPWWETAVPHRDIREGNFDESVFAADLGNAMLERGPLDYTDPEMFFAKTYMTHGLKEFLKAALLRLAGKGGQGVVQLRTPFGGGKTHALVALYHLVKHREKVKSLAPVRALLEEAGLREIPPAQVAGFVGTYADVVAGRTPWGAIAEQLGLYNLVRRHDEEGVAPGKERLLELLSRAGPVAVLIDEVLEYAVRARKTIGEGQVSAFLHELTEAAGTVPNVLVVLTLPASTMEIYDEHAEKLFNQIQKVVGRVETIHTPVEGEEIYEVIRRRLFERPGLPEAVAETSNAYFEYYQQAGGDLPAEAREPAYREKIRRAYPFHPELIDLLYHRWGSLPTFQRTRGVLRLLALVVGDLYRRQVPVPLIHPSHVNLGEPRIRAEFVKHTGSKSEYESVVAADLLGDRIEQLNAEMGSEYLPHKVAAGVATTIFLHSFSGAEYRRGVTLGRLKLCFLRPGFPATLVEGALQKLSDRLWYLHEERGLYYFSNVPNLNLIIAEQEESVQDQDIRQAVRDKLEELAGKDLPSHLWPEKPGDIAEVKRPTLVLLSPEYPRTNGKTGEFLRELFHNAGNSFRVYKNALFAVGTDDAGYAAVRQAARRYLALKNVRGKAELWKRLRDDQRKIVEEKVKDALGYFERTIIEAYRYFYHLGGSEVSSTDLGIPTIGTKSISGRVLGWLRDNEKLLSKISPEAVANIFMKSAERKAVQDIWEDTLKYPGMPLLENQEVLSRAIREGVHKKLFGLLSGDRVYFGEPSCPVDPSAEVLRKDVAERMAQPGVPPPPAKPSPGAQEQRQPEPLFGAEAGVTEAPPSPEMPRRYYFRAEIPIERLREIVSGVLVPLRQAGCELKVVLEVTATHEKGIGKEVLELKVKETLRQVGANILKEEG